MYQASDLVAWAMGAARAYADAKGQGLACREFYQSLKGASQ